MFKKRNLLITLFILVPLIVSIGFSAWVIIYEITFKPDKVELDTTPSLSMYYKGPQEVTYNKSTQVPSATSDAPTFTNLMYEYRLYGTNDEFVTGQPTDAEHYEIRVSADEYKSTIVDFTINPKEIQLTTTTVEQDYLGSTSGTWDNIELILGKSIKFTSGDETFDGDDGFLDGLLLNLDYWIKGMHNGYYYYGSELDSTTGLINPTNDNIFPSGYDLVIGTTYKVFIGFDNSNYTLTNNLAFIFKYKTIKVGSYLYTIEDALNNTTGTIRTAGDSTGSDSFCTTTFCQLSKSEGNPYGANTEFALSGRKLLISFDEIGNEYLERANYSTSGNVYSTFIIPKNYTLTLSDSAELVIAAYMDYSNSAGVGTSIATVRGIVMNHGTIIANSGCNVKAYGYLKGNGLVDMKSGSVAMDTMTIHDFSGGTAAMSIVGTCLPTNAWSLHNISCKIKINARAKLNAYVYVILNDKKQSIYATIISSSSSDNCIFVLNEGYIMKYAAPALSNITDTSLATIVGRNQVCGQRDFIEISGVCSDGNFSLELKVTMVVEIPVTLETSTDKPLPLGFMHLIIKEGSTMNLSTSDYVFFPGSSLIVESGAIVNVGSNVDVAFLPYSQISSETTDRSFNLFIKDKYDAKAEINGTINSSGNLGGYIYSTKSGSIINLSSGSISASFAYMIATSNTYTKSSSISLTGKIGSASSTGSFGAKSYISTGEGEACYWEEATNVVTFTINFYDDDKTKLLKSLSIIQVHLDTSTKATYEIVGNEFAHDKRFYEFLNWTLLDGSVANGTELVDGTSNSIDLYGSWKEIDMSIVYTYSFLDSTSNTTTQLKDTDVTHTNKVVTYKISDLVDNGGILLLPISNVSYNSYNFRGWFVGTDTSINKEISQVSIDELNIYYDEIGDDSYPLYLHGQFSNTIYYTLNFITNSDGMIDNQKVSNIAFGTTYDFTTLTDQLKDLTNNNSFGKYFSHWSVEGDSNLYINTYAPLGDETTITLTANWENKFYVQYLKRDGTEYSKSFYMPSDKVTVIDGTSLNEDALESDNYYTKHTFNYWSADSTTIYNSGSSFYIDASLVLTPNITSIKYCSLIVSTTQVATTLTYSDMYGVSQTKTTSTTETITYEVYVLYNSSPQCVISGYGSLDYGGYEYVLNGNTTTKKGSMWNRKPTGTIQMTNMVQNGTITALNTNDSNAGCFVEGTLITLADGTKKPVEELKQNDMVLVFNHELGKFDTAPVSYVIHELNSKVFCNVITLYFSDGTSIRISDSHGFFNLTLNKYSYINEENVSDFINHYFYTEKQKPIKLVSYGISSEFVKVFSPISYYHLNIFAEGLLTITNYLPAINIFEYDVNMKYDDELMKKDTEKYGLFEYKDFSKYANYDTFNAFAAKYLKVAIGKGYTTYDEIIYILNHFIYQNSSEYL